MATPNGPQVQEVRMFLGDLKFDPQSEQHRPILYLDREITPGGATSAASMPPDTEACVLIAEFVETCESVGNSPRTYWAQWDIFPVLHGIASKVSILTPPTRYEEATYGADAWKRELNLLAYACRLIVRRSELIVGVSIPDNARMNGLLPPHIERLT